MLTFTRRIICLAALLLISTLAGVYATNGPDPAAAHTPPSPEQCRVIAIEKALAVPPATVAEVARYRRACNAAAVRHAAAHRCQRPDLTPFAAIDCTWPVSQRANAKRVARCESTAQVDNATARQRGLGRWARDYAGGTHWGVFQLGGPERRAHGSYQLGDPALKQVRSALSLYRDRGWQPWSWSRHCHGVS